MRVLNLYAGLGGNRDKWKNVDVTAVEFNQSIADCYKSRFPQDKTIVADAHAFLLEHYKEFDFIWASPPCQTHSRQRLAGVFRGNVKLKYPDMALYQEIIILKTFFKGKWLVENPHPYYQFLIKPSSNLERHVFWSNFEIPPKKFTNTALPIDKQFCSKPRYGFFPELPTKNHFKEQTLRNLVNPEIGEYILELARRSK